MTVRIEPAGWASLVSPWAALHAQARPPAGAFVAPSFQCAWWSVFHCGRTLDLHAVRDGDMLVGVLPLLRDGPSAAFVGDAGVCDYMDLLAAPGYEADVTAVLLGHLDACGIQRVELGGLAPASPTLALLPRTAAARGWTVEREQEAVCPVLMLASDWDDYLRGIKSRYRREVRRKMRNLLDGGAKVTLEAVDEPSAIARRLPILLRFMSESRGDKAAFLTEQMAAFFHAIVRRMAPAGLLRLYFFHVDGRRVAAVLCLLGPGELHMYNSGYDPAYAGLSVGLASKIFVVRDAIERGLQRVNFLRGDETYKFQLGAQATPVTRLRLYR